MSDQPSNAPTDLTDGTDGDARDDATPAAVLRDAGGDVSPGGGALRGGQTGDGAAAATAPGGPSPNAPVDAQVSAGDAAVAGEARRLATDPGRR